MKSLYLRVKFFQMNMHITAKANIQIQPSGFNNISRCLTTIIS